MWLTYYKYIDSKTDVPINQENFQCRQLVGNLVDINNYVVLLVLRAPAYMYFLPPCAPT